MKVDHGLQRYLFTRIHLGLLFGFFLFTSIQLTLAYRELVDYKAKINTLVRGQITNLINEKSHTGDLLNLQRDLIKILNPVGQLASLRIEISELGGKRIAQLELSKKESWAFSTRESNHINTPIGDLSIIVDIGGDKFIRDAISQASISILIFAFLFLMMNRLVTSTIKKDVIVTDALLKDLRNFSLENYDQIFVEKDSNATRIKVLSDARENFYIQLSNFREKIIALKSAELKSQIALQLAHDIRSPLIILRHFDKSLKSNTQSKTFELAIERIEQISQNLLNEHQLDNKKFHEVKIVNLRDVVSSVLTEKRIEYSAVETVTLEVDSATDPIFSKIRVGQFKSVISNLINNAYEALGETKGQIRINFFFSKGRNYLQIQDTGPGVPAHLLNEIFNRGYTTKIKGNGLGLSGAKEEISSIGGVLSHSAKEGRGSIFTIDLDAYNLIVLIDDDRLMHLGWKSYFNNIGVPFQAFKSINDFLESASCIDKDSRIYIDSDLGNGVKGEIESEKVHLAGFTRLFLATGYDKSALNQPAWINEIYPKDPKKI